MLIELRDIVQDTPGREKRCFMDPNFTLFVWQKCTLKKPIAEFQLVLKGTDGHLLEWHEKRGFELAGYDDGESLPGYPKMSPIISASRGPLPAEVIANFRKAAHEIDPRITSFVLRKIGEYLQHPL